MNKTVLFLPSVCGFDCQFQNVTSVFYCSALPVLFAALWKKKGQFWEQSYFHRPSKSLQNTDKKTNMVHYSGLENVMKMSSF